MSKFIIFLVLTICIFTPMVVFAVIGYKALEELGKRPMQGGRVMIPLILKLVITTAILLGMLMVTMEIFG